MKYDFTQGDTGGTLRVECVKGVGQAIDLTGATVTLKWRSKTRQLVERGMTIVDAVNGLAEYQFADAELYAPSMDVTVVIIDMLGGVLHSREALKITVRRPI